MGFMDNPLYAGLVAGLEKKYRQREERVRALLASGDREALTHRAEDVRQRLCRSLTDADLLRTLGDARALPAGSLCLDGYAVENILLVFRHGYCVPVNVYVPRCGAGKHPALVVSIGHWSDGKTIRENQIFCANLARNGILAAAYDPLFQGERCPYDREALAELFGGLPEDMLSVSMHMQAGNLAYLLGRNVAACLHMTAWLCWTICAHARMWIQAGLAVPVNPAGAHNRSISRRWMIASAIVRRFNACPAST